jgi:hypothetical protein
MLWLLTLACQTGSALLILSKCLPARCAFDSSVYCPVGGVRGLAGRSDIICNYPFLVLASSSPRFLSLLIF